MKGCTSWLLLCHLLLSESNTPSVHIQHRSILGDKFTYAENKSSTTVDLLTGEKKVQYEETIYTLRIVELEDPLTNATAEYEKIYTLARFTPPDDRATRRLLSQTIRGQFPQDVELSLSEYTVGNRWLTKSPTSLDELITVTRVYDSDEYATEVITFDIEMIGTTTSFGQTVPDHYWIKKDIDVRTGKVLAEETIHKTTVGYDRKTDVTLKKLIKHQTHVQDL